MPIFEQLSKTNNVHRRGSEERYSEALSLDPLEPSAGGDSNFWDDALGFVGYGHSQSLDGMWPHYLYGCGHNVQFSDFNHSIQGCMLQPLLAMRSRMLENSPLIRKMVDERHSRANLGRGMHGIAARRLFRRCPVSRLPHNRRSGARSFSRRLGKRSTSPVLVHLGRPECVGSPLVDRFGAPRGAEFEFSQVGKSRANAAAGNGA